MQFLRSLLFAIIFYSATFLFVLVGIAALPFGRRAVRGVADSWAGFYGRCTRLLLGIRTRVEGSLPKGAVIVAGKHQSMYETLELVVLLDTPAMVMKRELSEIPLFGRLTRRYGIIPVDRSAGASALRTMLRAADEAKAEDRPIVIFPEGTRVAPGQAPPLQPGFAGLYRMLKLPVVPLALDSGRLWPRHGVTKRAGTITFRFGDPIPPGLPREEIEARVHAAINALE